LNSVPDSRWWCSRDANGVWIRQEFELYLMTDETKEKVEEDQGCKWFITYDERLLHARRIGVQRRMSRVRQG